MCVTVWNKHDHNYLATFLMEHNQVIILDIRAPSVPVAELTGHTQAVNTIAWAPHSSCHIWSERESTDAVTAQEDWRVLELTPCACVCAAYVTSQHGR